MFCSYMITMSLLNFKSLINGGIQDLFHIWKRVFHIWKWAWLVTLSIFMWYWIMQSSRYYVFSTQNNSICGDKQRKHKIAPPQGFQISAVFSKYSRTPLNGLEKLAPQFFIKSRRQTTHWCKNINFGNKIERENNRIYTILQANKNGTF